MRFVKFQIIVFALLFACAKPPQKVQLSPIGDKALYENQLLQFRVSSNNLAGAVPNLKAENLPIGGTFIDSLDGVGSFSWIPDFTQAGKYDVIFIASDGSFVDSESVTITVNNVNGISDVPVKVVSPSGLRTEMEQFADKSVVLNFWATWCGPCTTEIPDLVKFYQTIDTSKLKMIGVSADFFVVGDSAQIVAKVGDFLREKKVSYPNFIYRGPVDSLSNLFNLSGILPETIIYDSSGKEVFRHEDLITLSELEKAAQGL
ncbi:MAG: TlpA family protein disulfide reductase [candidate division Zixibacteria bacterium]|nr:TlpA family protein disulfide reductase [candidate division Zixibacteria bacterium]